MIRRVSTILCACLVAGDAFAAGINLQVFGGSRTTSFEPKGEGEVEESDESSTTEDQELVSSDRYTGFEYGFASLAQPVKEAPVAIGLFAMQQQLKGKNSDYHEKLGGIMAGVDAMAWLSQGIWQPFVRVGYDIYSRHRYQASIDDDGSFGAAADAKPTRVDMEGRVRGYHGAIGARVKPTPFVGAFLQVDFAEEKFVVDRASVTQDGFGFTTTSGDLPEIDLKSRSIMLGMDLGT